MNLIFFWLIEVSTKKKERKTFATMRIDAVFRPFRVDTSINRINMQYNYVQK